MIQTLIQLGGNNLWTTLQLIDDVPQSISTASQNVSYELTQVTLILLSTDSGPIADGVEAALRAIIRLIAQLLAFPLAVILGVIRWALRTPLPPEAPGIVSTPGATSDLKAYTPYFTDLQGFFEQLSLALVVAYAAWYVINVGLERYDRQGLGKTLTVFIFGVAAITVSGELIGIFYEFIDAFVYALLDEDPNELATGLAEKSLNPGFASDPESVTEVAAYAGLVGSSIASEALLSLFVGSLFQIVSAIVALVLILYLAMRIVMLHLLYAAVPGVFAAWVIKETSGRGPIGPVDRFFSIGISMVIGVIPIVIVLQTGIILANTLATQVPAGGYFFATAAITGASWISLKVTDTTRTLAQKVKTGVTLAGVLVGVGAIGGSLASVSRGAMFRGKQGAMIQGATEAGKVGAAKYEKEDLPGPLGNIFERVTSTPDTLNSDSRDDTAVADEVQSDTVDEEAQRDEGVNPFNSGGPNGTGIKKPTALSKLEATEDNELAQEWKDANPGEEALVDDEDPAVERKQELQRDALREAANRGELQEVDEYMKNSDDIDYDGMGQLGFSPQVPTPSPRPPTPDDRDTKVPQQNVSRPTSTAATDGVDYSSVYRDNSPGTQTGDIDTSPSFLPENAKPGEGYLNIGESGAGGIAPDNDVFNELTETELDIERQPDDKPGDIIIGGGDGEMEDIESTINRITKGSANIERADQDTSASMGFAVDLGQTEFEDTSSFVDAFEDDYVPVAGESAILTTDASGDFIFRSSASNDSFGNILKGAVTDSEKVEALGKGKYKVENSAIDNETIGKIAAVSPFGQGYDIGIDSSATTSMGSTTQSIPAPTAQLLDMETVTNQNPIEEIKRQNSEDVAEQIDKGGYLVRMTDVPDSVADELPNSAMQVKGLDGFIMQADTVERVKGTFDERNIDLQPATEKAATKLSSSANAEEYEVTLGRLGNVGIADDESVIRYKTNRNNEYEDIIIGAQPSEDAVQLRQLTTQYRGSNDEIKEQTAPAVTVDVEQIDPGNPNSQTRQNVQRKLSGIDGIRPVRVDSDGNGVQFAAFTDQTDPTHIADILREEGISQFEITDNYSAQQIDTGSEKYATQTLSTTDDSGEFIGIVPTGDGTAIAESMPDYRNIGVSVGVSPETGSTTIELTSSGDVDGEPEISRNEFANLLQSTINDEEFDKAIGEIRNNDRMPAIELQQRENAQKVIREVVGRTGVGISKQDGRRLGIIQEAVETKDNYTADVSSFIQQSKQPEAVEFTTEKGRISRVKATSREAGMDVIDGRATIPSGSDALTYRVGNDKDVDAAIKTSGEDIQIVVNREDIGNAMKTFGTDLIETQPEQSEWGTATATVSKKGDIEATLNEIVSRGVNDNRNIQVETSSLTRSSKSLDSITPSVDVPERGGMKVSFNSGYPTIQPIDKDQRRNEEVKADLAVRADNDKQGVEIEFDNNKNAMELRAKIEEELSDMALGDIVRLDDTPPRTVGVAQSDLEVEDVLSAVSDLDITVTVDEEGVKQSGFTRQENPRKQTHDSDVAGQHSDGWMLRD